jgi:hypothetical protein
MSNFQQKASGLSFTRNKGLKLAKAKLYFKDEPIAIDNTPEKLIISNDIGDWIEDSRRVFMEQYKFGINRTRVQMIRLIDTPQYKVRVKVKIRSENV